jgi:hypothetical protein
MVSALVVVQGMNSQVNLVGRPRQVTRKRIDPTIAQGKILVNSPGGRTT